MKFKIIKKKKKELSLCSDPTYTVDIQWTSMCCISLLHGFQEGGLRALKQRFLIFFLLVLVEILLKIEYCP